MEDCNFLSVRSVNSVLHIQSLTEPLLCSQEAVSERVITRPDLNASYAFREDQQIITVDLFIYD